VQQSNFHNYRVLRINETPQLAVHLINSTETPGGVGEPSTAVIGPAVANAVFAATQKRVRALPLSKAVSFV
jgi:isoquinoline 1-oxidoreductase beta subunit